MKSSSAPKIANDMIAVLKRGGDISAEITSLQKWQIEEVRQYSDTQLLILGSRLRSFNAISDIMKKHSGRRPVNNYEVQKTAKEIELFTILRSKMAELL